MSTASTARSFAKAFWYSRLRSTLVSMGAASLLSVAAPATATAAPAFTQSANARVDSGASAAATFTSGQGAGDLNVVIIAWQGAATAPTVSDTRGNTYTLAVSTTNTGSSNTQAVFFAANIAAAAAGTNTVTASFSSAVTYIDERAAEYSGVATSGALDTFSGVTGSGATLSAGPLTTTGANDLLVAGTYQQSVINGSTTGYTQRINNDYGDVLEDEVATSAGTYTPTITQDGTDWWLMSLVAFKPSGSGSVAPSAPAGLSATPTSSTQISLSWSASMAGSGGAVSGYRIQRCSGGGCTSFAQIGTSTTTSYSDTGLTTGTSYTYRVAAADAAGDLSGWSATASAIPASAGYVQSTSQQTTSGTSESATFSAPQNAGDLNVVIVGWYGAGVAPTVTDSKGNTYTLAVTTTNSGSSTVQSIYYAANILAANAGTNTVTVNFGSAVTYVDERIAEYRGVATSNPLDGESGATGSGASFNSGSVTTTGANDLLVAGDFLQDVTGVGSSGFTIEMNNDYGDILEDEITSSAGTYSASATQDVSGWWLMSLAAFKVASTGSPAPSAPAGLSATAASSTQVGLTWTASAAGSGGAVTGYRIQRCSGSGCTSFAQVGTATATTYTDTGLTSGSNYTYRVAAVDAAGDVSGWSTTASVTPGAVSTIAYVQSQNAMVDSGSSATAAFLSAQGAGDLNVVMVAWNGSSTMPSVTDTSGNSYALAVKTSTLDGSNTQAVFYAANIVAAGASSNTVTVSFGSAVAYIDERLAEYSGVSTSDPLDVESGVSGSGSDLTAGPVTTTSASDLLIAGTYQQSVINGTSTAYAVRINNAYGDILEDQIVSSAGNYSAATTQNGYDWWLMSMVAFKAATGGSGTNGPTTPGNVTATAVSPTQVNLTWSASSDPAGITGYLIERCQGVDCTNFTQIGTSTTTSYSDSGLSASTSYSYEIIAMDSAGHSSTSSPDTTAESQAVPTYTYTYDAHERVISATGSNGASITYTYDANGNRLSATVTSH